MGLIQALFLDVGGVLLTNGWDHALRTRTADTFGVNYEEMNRRHQMIFDTYETGKLTFDEYLKRVIFFEHRPYSMEDVKQFIFESARAYSDMIDLVKELKKKHNLKVGVVSNEGRELAVDRVQRFKLYNFVDFFIVSSFVHFRKPDTDIYHLAIDVSQVESSRIAYVDDRQMLVEVASELGIHGIHHTNVDSTKAALNELLSG